ncbi:YaaA family protein, partial [Jatrophihabitans sp. YIM 134969]
DDLAANADAADGPRRAALDRYAGVVYLGLDAATLPPAARRRAATSVLVFSGLYGVVRGDEPIPRYRVPAAVSLPGLGVLATYWKPVLTQVLPSLLHGLVVDLRSTDYAAMWKAPAGVLTVRVLSRRPSGPPVVVSYDSKLGKGKLTRSLLTAPQPARSVDDVVAAWERAGGHDAAVTGTRVDLVL